MMVLPLLVLPAGATSANSGGYLAAFEERSVLDDLTGGEIDGKAFSTTSYPYVSGSTTMQFISFLEYGYNELPADDALYNDYALFVYIYNPGNKGVSLYDRRHAITMKIGDADTYTKYPMILKSSGGIGDYQQLYLKFRVDISSDELRQKIGNSVNRKYDISEFEIVTSGADNATAYEGGSWSFSGFADGYGVTGSPRLTVVNSKLNGTVVIRDIGQGVWRSAADNTGWNYVQIDSVYFTIPHEITDRYGDHIVDILYEFYAYDSGWMVGFEHDKPYNLFKDYQGKVLSEPTDELPVLIAAEQGASIFQQYSYWVYNNRNSYIPGARNTAAMLSYVFKYAEGSAAGDIVDTDVRDYLSEQWRIHNESDDAADIFDYLGASSVFWDQIGPPTPYRKLHSKDLNYQLNTFDGNWWEKMWDCKSGYAPLNVKPIQVVDDDNVKNVEGELYLNNRYAESVKTMYRAAKQRGDNMYVFHFAASDYNSYQVFSSAFAGDDESLWVTGKDEGGFVCRESLFLDFDMLEMTFERDGIQTVLPVQMSPINVIGEVQLPDDYNPPDGVPEWVIILIAILILVVVVILCPALLPILVQIVILPIKLLWWLIRALGRGISGLIRSIKDRKK